MPLLTVARQLNIVSKISNWRQDTLSLWSLSGNANLLIERLETCLRYSPDQRCRSPRLQFLASVTVAPATYRISYWDCPNAGCNTVLRPDRCPPDADRDVAVRTMDAPRVTNPQSVGIYYRKSFRSNGEFDIVVVVFCWLGFWVNFRLNVMLVICWVKQIYIREGNGFAFGFYI